MPIRTSVSVTDMNFLRFGAFGGGNTGFALDSRIDVRIRVAQATSIKILTTSIPVESTPLRLLAEHTMRVWRTFTEDMTDYEVEILSAVPTHKGLGSSAAFQTALMLALNWLWGIPLSENGLRTVLSKNYREVVDERLTQGFSTGLASFLALYGGAAILKRNGKPLYHSRIRPWSYVVALAEDFSRDSSGEAEIESVVNGGRQLDRVAWRTKHHILQSEMIPALRNENLAAIGDCIRRIQIIGSKQAEIAIHASELYDLFNSIRHNGIECAFMSAVGPAIICISSKGEDDVYNILSRFQLRTILRGKLDSTGLIITPL